MTAILAGPAGAAGSLGAAAATEGDCAEAFIARQEANAAMVKRVHFMWIEYSLEFLEGGRAAWRRKAKPVPPEQPSSVLFSPRQPALDAGDPDFFKLGAPRQFRRR